MPTAAAVFEQTHSKKEGSERVLTTDKAKRVMCEYQSILAESVSIGIRKNPNEIYFNVVGGFKKGRIYGLGEASSLYFDRAKSGFSGTSSMHSRDSTQEEMIVARDEFIWMTSLLSDEREKFKEEKQKWRQEKEEEHDVVKSLMEYYSTQVKEIKVLRHRMDNLEASQAY